MECRYCGANIDKHDEYCKACGAKIEKDVEDLIFEVEKGKNPSNLNDETNNNNSFSSNSEKEKDATESPILGVFALIFTFSGGFLGFILSIIGLNTYKQKSNKMLCKVALIINIVIFILFAITFFINIHNLSSFFKFIDF